MVDRNKIYATLESLSPSFYNRENSKSEIRGIVDKYLEKKPTVIYNEVSLAAAATHLWFDLHPEEGFRTWEDLYELLGVKRLKKVGEIKKDISSVLELKNRKDVKDELLRDLDTEEGKQKVLNKIYKLLDENVLIDQREIISELSGGYDYKNPQIYRKVMDFISEQEKRGNLKTRGPSYMIIYKPKESSERKISA